LQLQDLEAQHYPYSCADNKKDNHCPPLKSVWSSRNALASAVVLFWPLGSAATFSDGAKIDNRILIAPKLGCLLCMS
jgi:hypothetical protein